MEIIRIKEILYCIEDKNGNIIARDLNMDNAMIFIRALFDNYFNEEDIAYTIKRQKYEEEILDYKYQEIELETLSDEEFDKVFTYNNADKAKIGMKGYFANTFNALKSVIGTETDIPLLELTDILSGNNFARFRSEDGFVYKLFYPIEEKL